MRVPVIFFGGEKNPGKTDRWRGCSRYEKSGCAFGHWDWLAADLSRQSCGQLHWDDGFVDFMLAPVADQSQIVINLEANPKLCGCAEIPRQAQRGVRRNGALLMNDFIDPAGRNSESAGQRILRQSERLHELLQEDFTRMNGFLVCFHLFPLVIIHDFHVQGIQTIPPEADPPLSVDSNAVLTFPVILQSFQVVVWWHL